MVVLIGGWIFSFLLLVFIGTLRGWDWEDSDSWLAVFIVVSLGWMWPLAIVLAIALAIISGPTYGVYRLAKYIRDRRQTNRR